MRADVDRDAGARVGARVGGGQVGHDQDAARADGGPGQVQRAGCGRVLVRHARGGERLMRARGRGRERAPTDRVLAAARL